MCDLLSNYYGYICNECFSELVRSGPRTDIDNFMNGEKQPNEEAESIARYSAVFEEME